MNWGNPELSAVKILPRLTRRRDTQSGPFNTQYASRKLYIGILPDGGLEYQLTLDVAFKID